MKEFAMTAAQFKLPQPCIIYMLTTLVKQTVGEKERNTRRKILILNYAILKKREKNIIVKTLPVTLCTGRYLVVCNAEQCFAYSMYTVLCIW